MTNLAVLRARKGKKVIVPFQLASYSAMTETYAPLLMMVLCLQFVSMTEPADPAPLNNAADGLTSELKESISNMMTEMMGSMKQQMLKEFDSKSILHQGHLYSTRVTILLLKVMPKTHHLPSSLQLITTSTSRIPHPRRVLLRISQLNFPPRIRREVSKYCK